MNWEHHRQRRLEKRAAKDRKRRERARARQARPRPLEPFAPSVSVNVLERGSLLFAKCPECGADRISIPCTETRYPKQHDDLVRELGLGSHAHYFCSDCRAEGLVVLPASDSATGPP